MTHMRAKGLRGKANPLPVPLPGYPCRSLVACAAASRALRPAVWLAARYNPAMAARSRAWLAALAARSRASLPAVAAGTRALPPAVAALAGYAGLTALLFWRLWASQPSDRAMIGLPDGDLQRQFYPYRALVADAFASGQLPLWNPHQYGGTPALADPQLAVLYPWRLLQVPLALGDATLPVWAIELEVLGHVVLAGWFTWLLLRRLGASALAAFAGGCLFAFGGFLLGYPLEQLAILETAAWLPAVLAALAADRRRHRRPALLAALATSCLICAGHPQTALYALLLAVAWLLNWAHRQALGWRTTWTVLVVWLAGAAALSAPQWLPAAVLVPQLAARFDPAEALAGLPPADIVQLWMPYVVSQWSPLYVGVAGLILGAWGCLAVRGVRFWCASALVAWLVALGGHGPLVPVLLRWSPVLRLFRHHERAAMVVSLSLAVAFGLALDALARSVAQRSRAPAMLAVAAGATAALGGAVAVLRPAAVSTSLRALGIFQLTEPTTLAAATADALTFTALLAFLVAAILALRALGRLDARQLASAFVVLAILDLFSLNGNRALAPGRTLFEADENVLALRERAREGRVSSEACLPGGPLAASVHGLYDVTGDSPIRLARFADLIEGAPEMAWWRLLGVRYVVTRRSWAANAPVAALTRSPTAGLFEVQLPAPPTWVAERWSWRTADWLPDAHFDPTREAILRAEPPNLAQARNLARGQEGRADGGPDVAVAGARDLARGKEAPPVAGSSRLIALENHRAVVTAQLSQPGLVVLSTVYERGWRAKARSARGEVRQPTVLVAYGVLPAVFLPAGQWTVEWCYWPPGLSFALVLWAVGLLTGGMLWRRSADVR